jgi:hypothetical protein
LSSSPVFAVKIENNRNIGKEDYDKNSNDIFAIFHCKISEKLYMFHIIPRMLLPTKSME